MKNESVDAREAEELHEAIDAAIMRLESCAVRSVSNLKDRIEGNGQKSGSVEKANPGSPPFISVLRSAPDRVHNCSDRIEQLVKEIHNLLFRLPPVDASEDR